MKIKKSTLIPTLLLAYLGVMAYMGLPHLRAGRYLFYFGIIAATLVIIILLHITLKQRENKKALKEDKNAYTTYAKDDKNTNTNSKALK